MLGEDTQTTEAVEDIITEEVIVVVVTTPTLHVDEGFNNNSLEIVVETTQAQGLAPTQRDQRVKYAANMVILLLGATVGMIRTILCQKMCTTPSQP